jgi:hypothetical protein
MKSFELSHHRRVNVWLDESPPASFTAASVVTRLVKPKVVIAASRRSAGVEVYIPHGPRASYALPGAELVETQVDGLELAVSVNAVGVPFHPSLASKSDEVLVGLPDEYVSAVLAGALRVVSISGSNSTTTRTPPS